MKIFVVGGAVRDELLKQEVKDVDWVVVDAHPDEMLLMGFKQVGADFPVFLHPMTGEEYALARVERKNGVGYHGFSVDTDGVTIEEDLSRRDLTINSMAREFSATKWGGTSGKLIDPFHGEEDLRNKVLRHTSPAFAEDPLRVIRLARFAARYSDFSIAPETEALAIKMIQDGELNHIPYERFWAEMSKVFKDTTGCPGRFFKLLLDWNVLSHVQFFHDVFGGPKDNCFRAFVARTAVAVRTHITPASSRMDIFTAICAREDFLPIMGATSELVKLHANLWAARKIGDVHVCDRQDAIFELMKKAKPWGEGPHYDLLVDATRIIEMSSVPSLCSHHLSRLRTAILKVKSSQFPNLSGKKLGQAIENARREAIKTT